MDPELNSPIAKARSFLGNHSATVFTEAGKFADSPKPNAARANAKLLKPLAIACKMAAILHTKTAQKYPIRVPNLSKKRPVNSNPIAYEI